MSNLLAAQNYIDQQPGAVDGCNGHDQTFKVTCQLFRRFDLTPNEVWVLLKAYNQKCRPRWSDFELHHKLTDAYKAVFGETLDFDPEHPDADPNDSGATGSANVAADASREKPDGSKFARGSFEQILRLSQQRGIPLDGLVQAHIQGVLVFGDWFGHEVYGVRDSSGNVVEIRRLDGKMLPAYGTLPARKSHAIRWSQKSWPLGIIEAEDCPSLALVEGVPDFLAAHAVVARENLVNICAPVAMLSSSPAIASEALPRFAGKKVRIFPHADTNGAGLEAAAKWKNQLQHAGVAAVDIFDFTAVNREAGLQLNDLNDFLRISDPEILARFPALNSILPH